MNADSASPQQLLQRTVLAALEELKAVDIVSIDVRGKTSVTDMLVVASGTSSRHVQSLAEHVMEQVKSQGIRPLGSEGLEAGEWALIDLNEVVVHVMQAAPRTFYDLESLWQSAAQSRQQQSTE